MMVDARDTQCKLEGNPDIYGLGVRLGCYLLCFSIVYASIRNIGKTKEVTMARLVFNIAMLVATVYLIAKREALVGEIYIMLTLMFSGVLSAGQSQPVDSTDDAMVMDATLELLFGASVKDTLSPSDVLSSVLPLVNASMLAWFYHSGLDTLPTIPCNWRVFFFTQVSLYGWFRTLGKLIATLGVIIFFIQAMLVCIRFCRSKMSNARQNDPRHSFNQFGTFLRLEFTASGEGQKALRDARMFMQTALSVMLLLTQGFMVANIELFIHWNRIRGVYGLGTVGQLIPLVTALCVLAGIIFGGKSKANPQSTSR